LNPNFKRLSTAIRPSMAVPSAAMPKMHSRRRGTQETSIHDQVGTIPRDHPYWTASLAVASVGNDRVELDRQTCPCWVESAVTPRAWLSDLVADGIYTAGHRSIANRLQLRCHSFRAMVSCSNRAASDVGYSRSLIQMVGAMLSLDKFKRYPLTFGPTPIEHLPRMTAALGGKVQIYAKRDDCNSGLAMGGNKLRKLEYIVPDAIASNADTLVSIGGVQSNHTRMVAATAAKIGMKCVVIQESWVPHEDAVYDRVGNILLTRLMGAESRIV